MKEVYIVKDENDSINVPILNIRMMTDDEWNRLSYQNWLDRMQGFPFKRTDYIKCGR